MPDDAPAGSAARGQQPDETNRALHRIGTAERQSAADALSEHTRAGRLTAQEYEERSETAKRALTWSDLDGLFVDLPAPHPSPGAVQVATSSPEPLAASRPGSADDVAVPARTHAGLIPERVGIWLVSLSPFIALALFFLTDQWWVFLLIPVAGMLVYGPGGHHGHGERDQKRARKRDGRDRG